jgi:hypothetical protein
MSAQEDKQKRSKRLHQKDTHVKKQYKIARTYNAELKNPHRLHKMHAMNCGDPNCFMCGNPRKFFGEKTIQELKFEQDVDHVRDVHSNGLITETQ